ncbi:hypothetical protein Q7C36_006394 [Tachysurus vachellii]|uniref:Uncharacterized protein n=1 Tax=Tachysurus vachellii TaxID=175792 RepID=A0AA88T1E6_TACVA|nr:hypothetical protein Q7C36_006394 [Tachysurus vachellii]
MEIAEAEMRGRRDLAESKAFSPLAACLIVRPILKVKGSFPAAWLLCNPAGTDNELAVSPMEGSSLGDCTGCSGGKGRGGLLEGTRIERESQGGLEERESGVWEEGMGGEMGGKREADHCQSVASFAIQIDGVRSGIQWCCINLLTANVIRILILDPVFLARPTLGPLSCQSHPSFCSPSRCPKTYTIPQARHPFTPAQAAVIQQRVRQVSHCAIKELEPGDKAEIPAAVWRAK